MCRHLGYVGPPVRVGDMLTLGTHSLRTQAWAPRDMRGGGVINADGFGVAWWREVDDAITVSRYRNPAPIWTDPAVEEVLPQLESWAVLGAVRSATVGMPVERSACAPFTHGRWAFSLNGVVRDWRRTLGAVAAEFLGTAEELGAGGLFAPARLLEAEAATDAATLWVLLRGLLATDHADDDRATAPAALHLLLAAVLAHAPGSRLNLLLGDGAQLWATTWDHALSALVTDTFAILCSEPFDNDPRWQSIPDRSLVTARPNHLAVEPLPEPERLVS
ncbi:ergothioneine biosynthesis protein EgtC [Nocardia arizonensis]|uniref:ergothioneine biosynthesis protein EgtC n=1 Tax=Nocardia arizonensis TaxID=1141647 RepID=UPI0006D00E85|nr:ergothioneine biosynthesis protein EgtC [Nocardia arizonensis]